MNTPEPQPVSIRILDKEFLIACRPEERPELLRSADLLNAQLRDVRRSGKVIGLERMLVMVALNMANDLARLRTHQEALENGAGTRVRQMRERVEKTVAQSRQLEL
jgi:cell division protein ZapA